MEDLQSHSTVINSHSMQSSKILICPHEGLMKIHSEVLKLSYASLWTEGHTDVNKPRHAFLQIYTVNSQEFNFKNL